MLGIDVPPRPCAGHWSAFNRTQAASSLQGPRIRVAVAARSQMLLQLKEYCMLNSRDLTLEMVQTQIARK